MTREPAIEPADPYAAWIDAQLAEPWPLSPEQLDVVCRALVRPQPADPAPRPTGERRAG